MSYNKGLLSGVFNDEIRNMKTGNIETNISKLQSDKYRSYLNREQTIKENLGQIFNDDSIGQELIIKDNKDVALENLELEMKHLIISGEDRTWHIDNNEDTFNFHVDCGDISLINNNLSSSANIRHSLENIVSLHCDGIIIPNRLLEDNTRPTNAPFIQLVINNIDNITYGTNKSLDKVLAILTPKIPLPNALQDISYIEFINTNKQKKKFTTPRLRLNKLDISIKRYDGEDIIDLTKLGDVKRDILNIKMIYYDINVKKLYIETNNYFNPNNFRSGDIIKVKDYIYRDTDLEFNECYLFNNFINRSRGHNIISTLKNNDNNDIIYHNIIEIEYPRQININTGKYEINKWFEDLINKTGLDSKLESDNTGILINSSLQLQILLTVTYLNKNSRKLIKNIDIKK